MNKLIINTGLDETDLKNIVGVLKKNDGIHQVILFGSRAKGNFNAGSDIDLALKGSGLNLDDLLNFSIELEELNLPYKFDLVIYDRIKEEALLEHIARVGIKIYTKDH